MSHTGGPWDLVWWGNEQYPFPLSILANNDGDWVSRGGEVSSEANARLIAAAPDLLEACDFALTTFVGMDKGNTIAANFCRAAIAKATQS